MTLTTQKYQPLHVAAIVATDVVLLAVACLIPTLSHVVALPLYVLNPMLAILLVGMLMVRDWRNGLLLAVLLPTVSCLLVGMPTAAKVVCMAAELATVAGVFALLRKHWAVLPAIVVAVVAAKAVYYALKALIVAPTVLVGTDWRMQAVAATAWCLVFAAIYSIKRK